MAVATTALTLATLPSDVTEQVLINADPDDVAAISQSSRSLYQLVYGSDNHIWRNLFLTLFDDPRPKGTSSHFTPYPWKSELQRRIQAKNILLREAKEQVAGTASEERERTLQILIDIISSALPYEGEGLGDADSSRNTSWVNQVLADSNSTRRQLWPVDIAPRVKDWYEDDDDDDDTISQEDVLRARLRAYIGLTEQDKKELKAITSGGKKSKDNLRVKSQSRVYDLRRYTPKTAWGPLSQDGSGTVDWVQLDAVLTVVRMNLYDEMHDEVIQRLHTRSIYPSGLEACRAYSAPGMKDRPVEDWAGLTGRWRRLICFMDYRELMLYNIGINGGGMRGWSDIFENEHFSEALHVLPVNIRITSVDHDAPESQRFPDRPKLHFHGATSFNGDEVSHVSGSVEMTPDGQVRWNMISEFGGSPRWSSLGIQVGGVGSAMGVAGIYTGVQHLDQDPSGPFWMIKVE